VSLDVKTDIVGIVHLHLAVRASGDAIDGLAAARPTDCASSSRGA